MFNRVLLIFILGSFLVSCGKREDMSSGQSSENLKHSIISALNKNDSELAYSLTEDGQQQFPTDKDFTYYRAQALSLKANIDIYSLFPLVKMQLFDIAINEWEKANEFEERRRQNTNLSILGEGSIDERYEETEIIQAKIQLLKELSKDELDELENEWKVTGFYTYGEGTEYNPKSCYIYYEAHNEHTPKGKYFYSSIWISNDNNCEALTDEEKLELAKKDSPTIKINDWTIYQLNERLARVQNRKSSERYIKAGFALFDGLPILRSIPTITTKELSFLKDALSSLEEVKGSPGLSPRLKDNSTKQIGLIGAYLITFSLASSIDLDQVKEPLDFACKINAGKIVENYPFIHLGFKSLLSVGIETEFYIKNKKNFDYVKEQMNLAPENLTDEQKEEFIDDIEDFQEDNC